MRILADTTPALTGNSGYAAAAYLVFFGLLLIYILILAVKLTRMQRDVTELNQLADRQLEAAEPGKVTLR